MANIWSLRKGAVVRIVKTFRDCQGQEFTQGRILHFTRRYFLPYHSGHTIVFREATMYFSDDDATSVIVRNVAGEYFE